MSSEGQLFFEETSKRDETSSEYYSRRSFKSSSPKTSPVDSKNKLFVQEEEEEDEEDEKESQLNHYVLFESQIRAIVPDICPAMVQRLFVKSINERNPVSTALNSYYDEIGASPQESQTKVRTDATSKRTISLLASQTRLKRMRVLPEKAFDNPLPIDTEWRRFIGSLQVVAWATRPTVKPLTYGTKLSIVKNESTVSKKHNTAKPHIVSSYVKLVQDANDPIRKKEIGRVPEDIAAILFPLVNQDICEFNATVVLCDGRLSTGDSFIIQMDCYLTSKIFVKKPNSSAHEQDLKAMRKKPIFNNSTINESESEQLDRKRQLAIFKLFQKLDYQVRPPEEDVNEEPQIIDLEDEGSTDIETQEPDAEKLEELNVDQLKEFYKRAQTSSSLNSLPETETRENFKLSLRSYQKQGLTWMLRSEHELEDQTLNEITNPLWKEFGWPKDRSWNVMRNESLREQHDCKVFYANLYSCEFSMKKPVLENVCRGGILADEMGLGKTISTFALIHNAPYDKDKTLLRQKNYAYRTSLIVVPTSLLTQWQEEFFKVNNDKSSILLYYGSDTSSSLRHELCNSRKPPMVVLTTYGKVQNEWVRHMSKTDAKRQSLDDGLFSLKFFRVVLDEGHNIRNRMAKTTKACYSLDCSRRWLLTGTPIINRLDDLFSLLKFLRLEPWSNISYWNTFVTIPFAKKQYHQALDVVQSILEPIILRRTKNMEKDGKALVELPDKEVIIERIKFSPKEQALYNWFLSRAESSVKASIARGDLLKKYSTILVHILRLRQICDHMDLIRSNDGDQMDDDLKNETINEFIDIPKEFLPVDDKYDSEELEQIKAKIHRSFENFHDLECSICTNQPISKEDISFTQCCHSFCISCILEYCDYQRLKKIDLKCPNCRNKISDSRLLRLDEDGHLNEFDNHVGSSKLNALLSHVRKIRDTSPNQKVVVFSQFSKFLDILEKKLVAEKKFTVLKFDGRLNLKNRGAILKRFKEADNGVTILLLSLKAGGVGLNLTEASIAFMCDPWWSPSVEDQAIDRIHRIGQNKNVKVVRFIMEGSIEEKMLRIQERKRSIGEAVEAEEEERRKRRVAEIQMLFE